MTRVDLIISTYNNPALLRACLTSLRHSRFTDFRLFIFDDYSAEPVGPLVRAIWPEATIIRSRRNVGLIRGLNQAIALGTSEYVVLLNDDTEVEPDWLGNLVACADRHPSAGSVASKLRLYNDRWRIHSAGDGFSRYGMPYNRGVWLDDLGQYDEESEIFSACGGAALYRRAALDAVRRPNGDILDSRLFMYCEDVDLAWRLQIAGYTCVFCHDAIVYHHVSATGGGSLASYYVARNVLLLLRRSVPAIYWRENARSVILHHLGRAVKAARHIREPAARATLRGIAAGVLMAAVSRDRMPSCDAGSYARIRALIPD